VRTADSSGSCSRASSITPWPCDHERCAQHHHDRVVRLSSGPMASHLGYRRCSESMQPVRALWKHGGDASTPAGPSLGILQDEGAVAHQRLDPCPRAPGRDARPQVLPKFAAPWLIAPGLREYGAPTQHPAACTLSLGASLPLDCQEGGLVTAQGAAKLIAVIHRPRPPRSPCSSPARGGGQTDPSGGPGAAGAPPAWPDGSTSATG